MKVFKKSKFVKHKKSMLLLSFASFVFLTPFLGNTEKGSSESSNMLGQHTNIPFTSNHDIKQRTSKNKGIISQKPNENINQDDSLSIPTLVWSDEFDYTGLPDSSKWSIKTGGTGWGNNELQYYTNSENNAMVNNGILTITAREEAHEGRNYTSARLTTQNKFDFKYGKVEARIKLPSGPGLWPAFWMLGANINSVGWPACGEIDIVELIGGTNKDNTVHSTLHWDEGHSAKHGKSYTLPSGIFADSYHIFSVQWNNQEIVATMDDIQYFDIDITPSQLSEFHDSFYILLNVAVGGNWPGLPNASTSFPQTMEVDYVRVYQHQ